jgi:hypothetical protein
MIPEGMASMVARIVPGDAALQGSRRGNHNSSVNIWGMRRMLYRLTLAQKLPDRPPSGMSVTCTFRNGIQQTWPVVPIDAARDTHVVFVACDVGLLSLDVQARVLNTYYQDGSPASVTTQIVEVQTGLANNRNPLRFRRGHHDGG